MKPNASLLTRLVPLLEAAAAGGQVSMAAGDFLREVNAYLKEGNYRVVPHPKLKREYVGRRVRTLRPFSNGWGVIPSGSLATVRAQNNKGSELISDACPCCGLQAKISAIGVEDIEFVEQTN